MNDEKDAALGRLLREKKEKQEHLTLLQSEARRIGQNLSRLGSLLESKPQKIGFDNHPMPLNYMPQSGDSFNPAEVDGERLTKLVDDIRKTMYELAHLTEQAKTFGF